ncbi:MAG: arylsulfatase [Acetobacter okinawensis]
MLNLGKAGLLLACTVFFSTAHVRAEPAPVWPKDIQPPKGAPNIVVILVDDVSFGATELFGGPIATPNFKALSEHGATYNNFHVNALCAPSRASLLTGYNDHQVGFGTITEAAAPYPGYNTILPPAVTPVAAVLKAGGYSTAAFGKWHNTPYWQANPTGPYDLWPTGRWGFEHFYGFLAAADSQYYPRLYRDRTPVETPQTPEQGYHFTTDITNNAINWLHTHDALEHDKPFFLYYATGATHEPHQVPHQWIEKYKGKFDQGWDVLRQQIFDRQKALGVIPANAKLTPRPAGLPAWDSLDPDQKKLVAHQMEVYAGFAEQTDHEIGRLLATIREEGQADNTLVLEIFGDNGGSAEGGPLGHDAKNADGTIPSVKERLKIANALGNEHYLNHYAAAWAWALTAPFQGTKQDASHLGGTTDPLVVSWPAHYPQAQGLRSQFSHLVDIAPTLYEAAHITPPTTTNSVAQWPLEGTSLLYTLEQPAAPSRHHIQYFATNGNRSIYADGWWAGILAQQTWEGPNGSAYLTQGQHDTHNWELYKLDDDYSQATNLAERYPEKLKELQALFNKEARRNQVDPLRPGIAGLYPVGAASGQKVFTYRSGTSRIDQWHAPHLSGGHYTLEADVDVPTQGGEGVIFADGGLNGGVTLFAQNHHLVYQANSNGYTVGKIRSNSPLNAGKHHIVVSVEPANTATSGAPTPHAKNLGWLTSHKPTPGNVTITLDGKASNTVHFANVAVQTSETLDIGQDLGSAVSTDYTAPAAFSGTVEKLVVTDLQ